MHFLTDPQQEIILAVAWSILMSIRLWPVARTAFKDGSLYDRVCYSLLLGGVLTYALWKSAVAANIFPTRALLLGRINLFLLGTPLLMMAVKAISEKLSKKEKQVCIGAK